MALVLNFVITKWPGSKNVVIFAQDDMYIAYDGHMLIVHMNRLFEPPSILV